MKRNNRRTASIVIALVIGVAVHIAPDAARSQFLTDSASGYRDKDLKRLPQSVARNIRAEVLRNVKGAVKITWAVHPESDDDFIVGRSTDMVDTPQRALKARSVKLVPAGADSAVVDSNLRPGKYYYVIVSRDRVQEKDIKLYPDVNYTTVPVVIDEGGAYVPADGSRYPDKVTLIHAMLVNRSQVLLTWKGVDGASVVYTVYRGSGPLNSPEKIRAAERLATVSDGSERFIDRAINRSGDYYYAVTTRDSAGNEDLQLVPYQSYTANGLYVDLKSLSPVSGIQAELYGDRAVRIMWSGSGSSISGYRVYRSNEPINSRERLSRARLVGDSTMHRTELFDRNLRNGSYYYAVLPLLGDGTTDTTLVERVNFTIDPVRIGTAARLALKSIRARTAGSGITVSWSVSGAPGTEKYILVRSTERLVSAADLEGGTFLRNVDISRGSYPDENPPVGRLYYALVPENYASIKGFRLVSGRNVTAQPVSITGDDRDRDRAGTVTEESEDEYDATAQSVDRVLKKYFYPGKYQLALQHLKPIAKKSESAFERAKAKLYIGRTLIEMRKYNRALDYLLVRDVKKYFPEDSEFWSKYAIQRVR
ncbi:MAG TPA: hypothetical protein PKJ16_17625 [Spirochaetota bacterium]|nr:hypothetical protein [Spirochaetota bacterium]HPU88540.1 hypothetical protein [Spirochaetota bacterium]